VTELALHDDFVFEPTAWDLAMAIGLAPDPDEDRAPYDELADAMLAWADGPEVDALTAAVVDVVWSPDLQTGIADGLLRVAELGDEWTAAAESALATFEPDPQGSPVTAAVLQQLAMQLGYDDVPPLFCLCCIDEAVRAAPSREKRAAALRCAPVARRDAAVPDAELAAALTAEALGSSIERLGAAGRRRAVRARLGRLGRLGRASIPALAEQLRAIAAERLPDTARDDDVWLAVGTALLADRARPELN
jgi:hypothetical protein